jgi:bacteriorhodopsin
MKGYRDGQNQLQQLVGRLAATLDRSRSAEKSDSNVHYASPTVSDVESACVQKCELPSEDANVWDISRGRGRQVSLRSNKSTGSKLSGLLEERRREVQDKYDDHHSGAARVAWYCEVATCVVFLLAWLLLLVLSFVTTSAASFVTTWFVSGIAAMTYYAKSCHMGDAVILGHAVPIARYIDWVTTTPLMLYELCHIAHASTSQTMWVIGCDIAMLVTGIIAALIPWTPHKGKKQVWFAISCGYYVLMVVALQVDVAKKAKKQTEQVQELFLQLEVLTVIAWSCYPIVCGLGRAHLGLITRPVEDILLCILDVLAKVGMEGFIVLSCINGGCASEASH